MSLGFHAAKNAFLSTQDMVILPSFSKNSHEFVFVLEVSFSGCSGNWSQFWKWAHRIHPIRFDNVLPAIRGVHFKRAWTFKIFAVNRIKFALSMIWSNNFVAFEINCIYLHLKIFALNLYYELGIGPDTQTPGNLDFFATRSFEKENLGLLKWKFRDSSIPFWQ